VTLEGGFCKSRDKVSRAIEPMIITCPHCKKRYNISDEGIKKIKMDAVVACPACKGDMRSSLAAGQAAGTPPPSPTEEKSSDDVKSRLAQALNDLPLMPQAFDQVRGLMADMHSTPADIADILETNPAISARVLRLVGMSLYGDVESVSSIQQAVMALDLKTLNEFVVLACASGLLARELNGYGLKAWDLWRHSLGVAYCARKLAARKAPGMIEEAFLVGLFHDCGKLVLNSFVEEHSESLLDCVHEEKQSFPEIERSILGFDHPQVGADVCVKWRIPKSQAVAIALHHTPSRFEHNPLACVLHAADATAMMSGIGSGVEGSLYNIDEKAMEFLCVDDDMLGLLMVDAAGYVKRTMECF
jgi:HD-like signal output (HDOD) protein